MAELEGYANAARKPVWFDLVNDAYREFVWHTECFWEEDSSLTVVDQAEYDIPTPFYKLLTDVIYDGVAGKELIKTSQSEIRRGDPMWLSRPSSLPSYYMIVGPNKIRLHDKPDTVDVVISVYGPRGPALLVDDDDYPLVPGVYHEAIAERAYGKAAKRWARGEARQNFIDRETEYLDWLLKCKTFMSQNEMKNTSRYVPFPVAERVRA